MTPKQTPPPFSSHDQIMHIHAEVLGIPVETVAFLHDEGEGLDQRSPLPAANVNKASIRNGFNALMEASLGMFVSMDRLALTPHAQARDVAGFFEGDATTGRRFFADMLAAPDKPAEERPAMLVLGGAHLVARCYARKLVFGPAIERSCEPLAEFARATVPALMHNPPQPPEQPLDRLFILHFMRAAMPAMEKALADYGHEGMAHVAHVLSRQSQAQFDANVKAVTARQKGMQEMMAGLTFLKRNL